MISAFSTRKRKTAPKTPLCSSCGSRNVSTEEDASVVCLDCGQIIKAAHREVLAEDTTRMVRTRGGGAMTRHVRVQRKRDKSTTPKVATVMVNDCLGAFRTVLKAQTHSLVRLLSAPAGSAAKQKQPPVPASAPAPAVAQPSFSQSSDYAYDASQSSLAPLSQEDSASPFKHQMSQSSTQSMSQLDSSPSQQLPTSASIHRPSLPSNPPAPAQDATESLTAAVRQVYTEYVSALKNCSSSDVLRAFYPPRSTEDALVASQIANDPSGSSSTHSQASPLSFVSWPRPRLSLTLALLFVALRRQKWPILAWDICFWARAGRLLYLDAWSHVPEASRTGALRRVRAFFVNRPIPSPAQIQQDALEVARFMRVNATSQLTCLPELSHGLGPFPDAWLVIARVCLCMDATESDADTRDDTGGAKADTLLLLLRTRRALQPALILLNNALTAPVVAAFLQTDNFSAEAVVALVCLAITLVDDAVAPRQTQGISPAGAIGHADEQGCGTAKSQHCGSVMPPLVASEWDPPWNTRDATKHFLEPGSMHRYVEFVNAHVFNRVDVTEDVMKYSYLLAREGHALKTRATDFFSAAHATNVDDGGDKGVHSNSSSNSGGESSSGGGSGSDSDGLAGMGEHKKRPRSKRAAGETSKGERATVAAWREVIEQELRGRIESGGLSIARARVVASCEQWIDAGRRSNIAFVNKTSKRKHKHTNKNKSPSGGANKQLPLSLRYRTKGGKRGGEVDEDSEDGGPISVVSVAERGAEALRGSNVDGVMAATCKLARALLRALRPVVEDSGVSGNNKCGAGGEAAAAGATTPPELLVVEGNECEVRLLELNTNARFAALMASGSARHSQELE